MASKQQSIPPAGPSRPTGADADSALIKQCNEYILRSEVAEAENEPFDSMRLPYTAAAQDVRNRLDYEAEITQQLLWRISVTQPKTQAGLVAQARAFLQASQDPRGCEFHVWNLAESVVQLLGEPPSE
jgi:hypothetical protein